MKILLTVLTLCCATIVNGQYSWTQKASMTTQRYAGTGFTIGTKSYICTGYNTANITQSDLWEWDQATNVWSQKADIVNSRFGAVGFAINGFGYVGLGLRPGAFLNDLQRYDPLTNSWAPMASLPTSGRYGSSSFAINGKGYIACGNLGSATGPYSTELWQYNPIINTWTAKSAFPGLSRYGGRGAALNNLGYVFGGLNGTGSSTSSFFADLWEYNETLDSWTQKVNIPGLGRSYATAFILNNKFVAGSGIHFTGTLNDFYAFDPLTNTWSTLPPLPATPRWGAVGFDIGASGYIATGLLPTNIAVGELWELSVVTLPAPVITSNGNGGNLGCNPSANTIDNALGTALVTGGCNASLVVSVSTANPVSLGGCISSVTRTFTAVDSCGNAATPVSVTVTYKNDLIPPTITANSAGGNINCSPTANQIDAALGGAMATDNCDASVIVNFVTSTPVNTNGCNWSVTRTFTAVDSCVNEADPVTVTVTYKMDQVAPVIVPDKSNDDLGCNPSAAVIDSYLGSAVATDNCDASVIVNTVTSLPINVNGCIWSVTRTHSATDSCGNAAVNAQVTVTYKVDLDGPVVTCNAGGNITVCDGNSVVLNPSALDACDGTVPVSCVRSDGLALTAQYPIGSTTVTCSATDVCGNTGTCSVIVTVDCNQSNPTNCTYTQGAYGNAGGTHCDGTTTTPFLTGLLSTPLVIGGGSNTLTINASDVASGCFYTRLPGGGQSLKLSGAATCSNPVGITLNGAKFKNSLVTQTITMGLNLRIPGSTLGNLHLTGQYLTTYQSSGSGCNSTTGNPIPGSVQTYTLPASVIAYLGVNNTVNDLYNLANLALSGAYTGTNPSRSKIASALSILNNAFDECRILGTITNVAPLTQQRDALVNNIDQSMNVKAYPNPFSGEATINFILDETGSNVTVELYNLTGQKLETLFNSYAEADKDYAVTIDGSKLLPGIYIYYVKSGNAVYHDKITVIK